MWLMILLFALQIGLCRFEMCNRNSLYAVNGWFKMPSIVPHLCSWGGGDHVFKKLEKEFHMFMIALEIGKDFFPFYRKKFETLWIQYYWPGDKMFNNFKINIISEWLHCNITHKSVLIFSEFSRIYSV